MSDSKGASRRPPKGKTIDLEAKEVAREELDRAQDASPAPEPVEAARPDVADGSSDTVQAAPESASQEAREAESASQEVRDAEIHDSGTAPAAGAASATAPRRGAGPLGLLAAAILGGVVAAGGLVGLGASGLMTQVPGLGGSAPAGDASAGLAAELASLRDKVEALEASPATAAGVDPRVEDLETRIGAVEAEAASLREALAAQQSAGATGEPAQQSALAERIDALEAQIAQSPAGGGGADSAVIAQLSGKVDAGLESVNAAMAQAGDKIAAVEGRVNALEQSVSRISSDIEAGAASGKGAARMIAADTLKNAAEEGRPFADLTGPVEALIGPSPQLDVLKAQAASGLARPATLLAEFEKAQAAILVLDEPKPDGMLEGLIANARSLVKVQPAGPLEGNTNEAVVSRIRAALEAGNLSDALAQWESLPDAARTVSAEWGARLKARVEAQAALESVLGALAQG